MVPKYRGAFRRVPRRQRSSAAAKVKQTHEVTEVKAKKKGKGM
jgi:hypothetical protein